VTERVAEAATLLRDYPLRYNFVKRGRREALRGRPVVFASWSELTQSWHVVEIEVPFPAPRLRAGRRLSFKVLTPGYGHARARSGSERLMFDIFHNEERLRLRAQVPTDRNAGGEETGRTHGVDLAEVTHYLPLTDDSAPLFAAHGHALLRSTAETALRDLRERNVASFAYPGELLADTVLPETLMSLAVIEQTDDGEFFRAPTTR
jgi:hypothetical protein